MDPRRLLIQLPPNLATRARAEIESPDSSFETLNQLINEALSQYLEELSLSRGQSSPPVSPRQMDSAFSISAVEEKYEPSRASRRKELVEGEPVDDGLFRIDELAPPLASVLRGEIDLLKKLALEMDQYAGLGARVLPKPIEPDAIQVRDLILKQTRIEPVDSVPFRVSGEVKEPNKDEEALFGLHNRDYPSLWALQLLARSTIDGPVLWSEFTSGIERTGREMGRALKLIDQLKLPGSNSRPGLKCATAFPVTEKALSHRSGQWIRTEDDRARVRLTAYVKNTVARIQGNGRYRPFEARGPLPRWSAIAFEHTGEDFRVGVTSEGLDLLRKMSGISLELPHDPFFTYAFMDFLRDHGRGDYEGFRQVLGSIQQKDRNRDQLTDANWEFFTRMLERSRMASGNQNDRSYDEPIRGRDTYVSTMTQGYVARGREWGLVVPELSPDARGKKKIYRLTSIGEEWLAGQPR